MDDIEEQPEKAWLSIDVTELPIDNEDILLQP